MVDFLESSSFGSESSDPVMAAINGTESLDEFRFGSNTEFSAETADIDIEGVTPTVGEDLLLVPQNAPEVLNLGKDRSELGKDPLTGETDGSTVGEADPLTGGNTDEVEIETRARKRDKGGNSLKKARNLGVLTDDKQFKEFVGKSDSKDFYKFRVNEKTDVDIELRGLSGNADLYLLNNRGKVIDRSAKGGKGAEDIERTLNPGSYYVRVQPKNKKVNANYTLSLDADNPHFHVDEPIIINIVDTAADAPTSLDDSSTIDLMVAYTPEARLAEGGTAAMKELIEFAVDDANEIFAKSGVRPRLRLVHTAEVNYTESKNSLTDLSRLKNPEDGFMDEAHKLRDRYGADIVSLFASKFDDAGGRGYLMGTPAYGFESHAFNVVTNSNARNRHTLAHEIGHNLGLHHDRDNADGQGSFPYGYGYTTPSGAGTIMSYAGNRLKYFSNPAISYNGEALGRTNLENSALAINKVAQYAANWRPSAGGTTKPKDSITVNSPNGGNTLEPGSSYTITWSDNISENVKLELYKGSSLSSTITSSTSSDGSYYWSVPTSITDGSDYRVKITSTSDSSFYDYSNSYFTIKDQTWPPTNYKNLGTHTGRQEYNDYVGSDDYYKFYVNSPGHLQFALQGMSADANVQLLDSSGRLLTSSSQLDTSDEYGSYNLSTGTHYMRVYGNGGNTNYRLTLNLDQAGEDMNSALELGDLTGDRIELTEFVGKEKTDEYDYYRFSLNQSRWIQYALKDFEADPNISILDSAGRVVETRNDTDWENFGAGWFTPGTYYAKVSAPSNELDHTNYKLVLNLLETTNYS